MLHFNVPFRTKFQLRTEMALGNASVNALLASYHLNICLILIISMDFTPLNLTLSISFFHNHHHSFLFFSFPLSLSLITSSPYHNYSRLVLPFSCFTHQHHLSFFNLLLFFSHSMHHQRLNQFFFTTFEPSLFINSLFLDDLSYFH